MPQHRSKGSDLPRWNGHVLPCVRLNLGQIRDQVHLLGLEKLGPVNDLPPKVEDRKDTDHGVREQERSNRPVARQEHLVAPDESHDRRGDASNPGNIGLEPAAVRQSLARDALGFKGPLEPDVRECDHGEIDKLRGRDLDSCQSRSLGSASQYVPD